MYTQPARVIQRVRESAEGRLWMHVMTKSAEYLRTHTRALQRAWIERTRFTTPHEIAVKLHRFDREALFWFGEPSISRLDWICVELQFDPEVMRAAMREVTSGLDPMLPDIREFLEQMRNAA